MTTTPLTNDQITALYSQAMAKLQTGQPDQALPLFGRIIETNPNIAEPHWQVARLFADGDTLDRASDHAAAAARLKPGEPVVWATWADIAALEGGKDAERAFLDAVKTATIPTPIRIRLQDRFGAQRRASRPDLAGLDQATLNRVSQLIAKGDLAPARDMVARMLTAHPKSALLHNMMGSVLSALGQGGPALAALRRAQKLDPFYAEAWLNEANELARQGLTDDALQAYRHALSRAPDMEQALLRYVTLLNQQTQPGRARRYMERLVRLYPGSVAAHIAAGNTFMLLREHHRAAEALEKALALSGNKSAEAMVVLSQVYSHLDRDREAEDLIERALVLRPDNVMALNKKASLLQTAGRFEEADLMFRKALEHSPLDGELFRSFIIGYKVKPGDPIVAQMQTAMARPDLPERARLSFAFALGKALEDQKDYASAFPYIKQANDLTRKLYPYEMKVRHAEIAAMQRSMGGFDWAGTKIEGTTEAAPVFVTGMPRSGTTLIEQIIASHSRVTGAGELAVLQGACQKLLMTKPDGYDEIRMMADIAPTDIAELGHAFLRELAVRFPGADVITDKSITTYMYIGLVKLALPNARIIVVRRDPRDTLLSIYKNRFPEGTHLYAYDLRDLANYYVTFVEMVEFWRKETPDWFTEVEYETLVANPEEESRRLIAAAGLDWEDACLNFHQNKRKIDTLSVYQVRQPISGGSVKAWQRYEAELAPMIDILRERGLLPD
jgi:tetratricopeptide (TPR) repeat protein